MSDDFRRTAIADLLKEEKTAIEPTEIWCVEYLQKHKVLPGPGSFGLCGAVKRGVRCGAALRQYTKSESSSSGPLRGQSGSSDGGDGGGNRTTVFMRCTRKHCQTYKSLRDSSTFLTYYDKNDKCRNGLSLVKIMVLVWCWVCDIPGRQAAVFTSRSHHTVLDWYRRCRTVVASYYEHFRGTLGGQFDFVKVDIVPFGEDDVKGPWIFGLCGIDEKRDSVEWRYFFVHAKDESTLRAIISAEVQRESVICSDGILELGDLLELGYYHVTNGPVEPGTYFSTLNSLWRKYKKRYCIRYDGNDDESVSDKLKTIWWRSMFVNVENAEIFDIFWHHLNTVESHDVTAGERGESGRRVRNLYKSLTFI